MTEDRILTDLLEQYERGDLTTKELLGQVFSYLDSHRDAIEPVLGGLQGHYEASIRELGPKLHSLLGVTATTHDR